MPRCALRDVRRPIDLSIVVPTCNRAALLARCLRSIDAGTKDCRYEVIVVDGASTDETPAVVADAEKLLGDRLCVIREARREGFVRAANKGFAAAAGRYVTWLNDDARPLPGAHDRAVAQLDASGPEVGLVALFHRIKTDRNVAYTADAPGGGEPYKLLHVRGTLYANFGVGRRALFQRPGGFDERFFLNGADPDLSLQVWHGGRTVVPAFGAFIDHDEHDDDRRETDTARASADNEVLFAKWDLPPRGSPAAVQFDPARPCTLRGRVDRSAKAVVAA
jgi:GT2 family glycosyltransferase